MRLKINTNLNRNKPVFFTVLIGKGWVSLALFFAIIVHGLN